MRISKYVAAVTVLGFTLLGAGFSIAETNRSYEADLSGSEEIPPVSTDMTGHFVLNFMDEDDDTATSTTTSTATTTATSTDNNDDELEASYELHLDDGEDVTMAHLHCGEDGVEGPPVATLFDYGTSSPSDFDGLAASSTITEDDLLSANCDGNSIEDLDELADEIDAGNIYVNVHTSAYPDGEVRGQVMTEDDGDDDSDDEDDDSDDEDEDDDSATTTPDRELSRIIDQIIEAYLELVRTIRLMLLGL